jgi:hypothetical protein
VLNDTRVKCIRRCARRCLGVTSCSYRPKAGEARAAILQLDLQASGMEFASEMVVKATVHGLRLSEVPVILWPDGRSRPPHLRSWRDGWRHLRFLLLFSPRSLFFFPGAMLAVIGFSGKVWLLPEPRVIGHIRLDIHSLLNSLWHGIVSALVSLMVVRYILLRAFAIMAYAKFPFHG